jgi:VWFA-related protein
MLSAALAARQGGSPQADPTSRQNPAVTFKVEINYVEVDAVVTDREGRFVPDLVRDDFEIFEDGKRQSVSSFGLIDIPVEKADAPLFAPRAAEPDVATNQRPFDGRVYVLVLDDLHTEAGRTPLVRAAARRFVETQLGANDVAAVIAIRGSNSGSQEFTANKRLLNAAIDRFSGKSLRSATLNRVEDYYLTRGIPGAQPPRDVEEHERAFNARSTLVAIRNISDFMANVRGRRKALVLFSEGIDYDIMDVFNNMSASDVRQETFDAIAAATRANVSIYSVDARGLTGVPGLSAEVPGFPMDVDPALRVGAGGMQDELRVMQDSLRVLSDETGGFATVNTNDFATAFDRIQDDNSRYYVLGYYPTNDRRDGRVRKIEVRVKRPGVTVRSRKAYVAPRGKPPSGQPLETKEGTSPALKETLSSPVAISGLRLTASAVPFKGAAGKASVLLIVQPDGRDLRFTEKDGRYEGELELSALAVDKDGKVSQGVRQLLKMPLKPESFKTVSRMGVRLLLRIELAPGQYQLRVGALDRGSGRTGSVHYDLEVPRFTEGPLTMSGLAITSSRAGAVPTPTVEDDEIRKMMPAPPTVEREFSRGEELALLAEVYDNETATPHRVDITATLRGDDGREVFRHQDERATSELQGGSGGFGYAARVPLRDVQPGLYLLRVEARSRLGKGATAFREVQIRVGN